MFCGLFHVQEEKKRLKEEIEKRRAEAAEKRQKGEGTEGEAKAAFSVAAKGSSSKVQEVTHCQQRSHSTDQIDSIEFLTACLFCFPALDWRESWFSEQAGTEEVTSLSSCLSKTLVCVF